MISRSRICASLATVAGGAILCSVTAFAQAAPGSMQPQQQQPNPAASEPGMSPMNQPNNMNAATNGQASPEDKMFVKKALQGGMAEVQLGQLAVQNGGSEDVKQFGQKMVDDHTKLGDQMKPIAQQIGVKVPDGPSKKDLALMAKLKALNGDAFDKAYIKDMVKDHKADLNDFKTESQQGSSQVVKDAANQGSQVIAQHLQMAEQIAQKDGAMASK